MFRIQENDNDNNNNSKQNFYSNNVDQFRKQLIDYIYTKIDISRFKYELLQYDVELPQLLKQKYFVSANFSGSNCLFVFTKIRDKFHSYLIDRKTLSYNVSKIDISKVKMINSKVKLDPSIFLGTIFDGIYVQNKDEKMYIITDVYLFKGEDFTNTHLNFKLHAVLNYLKSNYNEQDKDNTVILTVNKLYDFNKTEHLITSVIPNMKHISVRGICFYPETSGTKLIYLFSNDSKVDDSKQLNQLCQNLNNSTGINNQKSDCNQVTQNIAKTPKNIAKQIFTPKTGKQKYDYIFEMKKTELIDVYILNLVEIVLDPNTNKRLLKRKKADIAFVPDMDRSIWCKEIFTKSDSDAILVKCKFHSDKNKWEPFETSNASRPSIINEFDIKYSE